MQVAELRCSREGIAMKKELLTDLRQKK